MAADALVVISDLDGTLLDRTSYEFAAARPAIDRLRAERVPLVLCTSKTRAEVELVRTALGNTDPFIVENGGGLYVPVGYFPFEIEGAELRDDYWVVPIGDSYPDLVATLARASQTSGVAVRGFATMSDADVVDATGLTLDDAHRARQREFDEPFVILEPERAHDLLTAIEREGMRWTSGGRFHHVMGASDKRRAVDHAVSLYRRLHGVVRTVGLGDAPNDASFLNGVDVPILMASPHLDALRTLVPHGRATAIDGPAGWNEAVLSVLDQHARDRRR
jgi:mannosyl-3-phosphoglycerate phosphatase